MTDQELREWVADRYGDEAIADDVELARQLRADVATVEKHGTFPLDDEMPYDEFLADLNERLRRSGRSAVPAHRSSAL